MLMQQWFSKPLAMMLLALLLFSGCAKPRERIDVFSYKPEMIETLQQELQIEQEQRNQTKLYRHGYLPLESRKYQFISPNRVEELDR